MANWMRGASVVGLAWALSPATVTMSGADDLTWVRTGGPPGGLGYDIRFKFDDPDVWYVTDSYAGIFVSTDRGQTWQPSNNGIPAQGGPTGDAVPIFCVTVDPHNPDILWAGTNPTGHIYRSTNGGSSWEQRDTGVTIDYGGGLSFRGFTVDPRTSDIVYAMAETGDPASGFALWGSGTGGQVWKTTDAGAHWTKIWDGGMPSSLARYMWINPENPDRLYVSTGIFDRGAVGEGDRATAPFGGLGILRSDDGGQTWEILNETQGLRSLYVGSLFMHPDDPNILLAATGHQMPPDYAEKLLNEGTPSPHGVYRTTDGGDSWTQVLQAGSDYMGECFSSVELCPTDPNLGYAGSDKAVYFTTDAGITWALVTDATELWGPPGVVAGSPIDMQCDPLDPDRIFANNYNGGNFLSEDGGHTWINASDGYTGAQSRQVAADPFDPERVYAAGRSGIWRSDDRGAHWEGIFYTREGADPPPSGTEWLMVSADPSRPDHILGGHGMLLETTEAGDIWDGRWLSPGIDPVIGTVAFAPSNPATVYVGLAIIGIYGHETAADECPCPAAGVMVSHDGGTNWAYAVDENISGLVAFDVAVDPEDEEVVYMASGKGLYQTTDAGTHWTLIFPHGQWARAVAVHPSNGQYILIGVEQEGVYISADGGATWAQAVAGLAANSSIHDIVFDPIDPQTVYLSDFFSGVYRSQDGGETWETLGTGLGNRAALGLSIPPQGHCLYVATEGGGVHRIDLRVLPAEPPPIASPRLWVSTPWPNPTNGATHLRFRSRPGEVGRLRVIGVGGSVVRELAIAGSAEEQEIYWDGLGSDGNAVAAGVYYLQLTSGGQTCERRLSIVRF